MSRDRYVDFIRASAIVLVVVGHWLITSLSVGPEGDISAPELLASVPWTQWLTLGFQIMPLFFLAGGYAAAGSWVRARARGMDGAASGWVRRRSLRLLIPVAVYAALVLLAVGVCSALGVDPDILALVGWAMAMQFWFLPVYLLLSALTPVLHAAHRRWGLLVPLAMGAAAVAADVWVVTERAPYIGMVNYLLVWGVAYQLGFCWRDGLLAGRRLPAVLALGGGAAFAALITMGPFPVSLILVTGQETSNTDPPSAAMLAWAVAEVGLCLLAAPVIRRRVLDRERVRRVVRVVGGTSMVLYLWHMVPVLVVAAAFYLTRIAPEPAYGSVGWWVLRVPWLVVLGVVLAGVLGMLRPLERQQALLYERTRPESSVRHPWALWLGLAASVAALARFSVRGFAYDGRFPVLPTLGLALGVALMTANRPAAETRTAVREAADGSAERPAVVRESSVPTSDPEGRL